MIVRPYVFAFGLLIMIASAICLGIATPNWLLSSNPDNVVPVMVGTVAGAVGAVMLGASIRSQTMISSLCSLCLCG
jgi:hypothetical protein